MAIQSFAAQKRNANTRWAYVRDMRDYQGWCEAMGIELEAATRDTVNAYVVHLTLEDCHCQGCRLAPGQRGKALAPSTVSRRLSAISAFYEYLIDMGAMDRNPASRVERPKVPSESQTLGLSADELSALVRVAGMRSARDLALVGVLALTGLRISEALSIQVGDLTEQRGHHVVTVTRKGGEHQVMVIAPPVVPVIRELEAERGSGYLFLNGKGERLSRQQASALVSAMARKAGMQGSVTAHSLRHTYVTLALDAGVSLRDVAAGAGHRDVRTTMRYDRARHSLERSPTYAVTSHVTWDASPIG